MKRNRLKDITVVTFFVLLAGFALLMIYMGKNESNDIYNARGFHSACTIQPDGEQMISDDTAPAGVRKEFTFTISDTGTYEDCFAFYLVHHYAQVWFDGELVYSLSAGAGNSIGESPSSNWVILPLQPEDREITVILTPVYESVISRITEFQRGPRYDIVMSQLKADFPQLVLSVLCILVGLLLIIIQVSFACRKKSSDWALIYLGIFTLLVGLWRITDTRSSSILFLQNSMLLGYITISALFLVSIPFPLYMLSHYRDSGKPLLLTALFSCICAAAALLCQALDLADLRQMLTLSHIVLILVVMVVLWVCLLHAIRGSDMTRFWKYILPLAAGFALDLVGFYIRGNSAGMLFTVLALLAFSVSRAISIIYLATQKAYIDPRTGLFNKNRWDELMRLPWNESDTIGIMMLDLNCLKSTNDTMGHDAGDRMIQSFANILQNTIPAANTICRWGGDEFTVLINNASREKVEQCVKAVADAAAQHNDSGGTPKIHYAVGWVLSSEFPGLTPDELLKEADKRMYADKRQWYSDNQQSW